jgi:hypothetical protein
LPKKKIWKEKKFVVGPPPPAAENGPRVSKSPLFFLSPRPVLTHAQNYFSLVKGKTYSPQDFLPNSLRFQLYVIIFRYGKVMFLKWNRF